MDAPHGYVRLLATKHGLGYLHPHTLPFDFVIDEIAHDFTDEYEDDENDIDDLTVVDHKMAANQPRVPAGSSAGGQFGSTGGGAGAGGGGAGAGGQTDTAEFKAWFGDSKVVDADGNPQVVYHGGGPNEGFDHEFIGAATMLGPGFYFTSNADQANEYVLGNDRGGAVKPAYISIQNPMVIDTDVSGHARDSAIKKQLPASTIESLIKSSPVANPPGPQSPSQQERTARNVKDAITQFSSASEHDAFVAIGREFYGQGFNDSANHFESYLTKFTAATGYDGIISGTMTPGPASLVLRPKIVVVAFQPQQIKSSIGNSGAFDPTSRDITKMAANQPRVPAGSSAGGQFGSTAGGAAGGAAGGGSASAGGGADSESEGKWLVVDGEYVYKGPVYHGTDARNLQSIVSSGLIPTEGLTWFASTEGAAQQYGGKDAVILKMDGATIDGLSYSGSSRFGGVNSKTSTEIAASKIKVRVKNNWVELLSLAEASKVNPYDHKMAANQPRVPAGSSAGGQFGSTSGAAASGGAGGGMAGGAGKQTDTAEFKAWFGDSKVVDADGNPVVVFHGTHTPIGAPESPQDKSGIFFSSDADVANAYAVRFGNSLDGGEAYDKLRAKLIAQGVDKNEVQTAPEWQALQAITRIEGSQVAPVYLKISNPLVLDGNKAADAATANRIKDSPAEHAKLKAQGYDGMIIHNVIDRPVIAYTAADAQLANKKASVFVVFSTTQIKSSIGNSGAFDPTSRDITKMAANQPRVPAGSSAGGQFGSTGGTAASGGAGGGMAASEALLTPTTGHYEMAPDRTVSPGNEAAVAYGKANSTLQESENEGLVSPEIVALSDYVGSGYSETNNLIRANDGLYENLTGPMEASYLSLPREANGFVVGFNSSHTEATSILEDSIRTTYRNGLLEYKGSSRTIDASESAQALQHTGALARLVDNAPALQPTVVYRGVGGNSPGVRLTDMQEALNSGGTVKLNGFTSTSLNPHVAHDFSDNNDRSYVMAIVTRRGLVVNGGPTAGVLGESEVIIPHGTTFKVHAILPAAPGTFYRNKPVVQMIQVDAPATKMAANQPRVPAGSSAGGQFGSTSGAAAGGGSGGGGAGGTSDVEAITDRNTIKKALKDVDGWRQDGTYQSMMAKGLASDGLYRARDPNPEAPSKTYVKRGADGKVVAVINIEPTVGNATSHLVVHTLAVNPAAAGQGIGRQMMSHASGVAAKSKRGLTLNADSDAVGFYEAIGMKRAGGALLVFTFTAKEAAAFAANNPQKSVLISSAKIDSLEPISGLFAKPTTPATKMAANQPRVPAGSSAGGQFGSTGGAAAGGGAGGGAASADANYEASAALLTSVTGMDEDLDEREVSPKDWLAVAYGQDYESDDRYSKKAEVLLANAGDETRHAEMLASERYSGAFSPEGAAVEQYTNTGYSKMNTLIQNNPSLYEQLTTSMAPAHLKGERNEDGMVEGLLGKQIQHVATLKTNLEQAYPPPRNLRDKSGNMSAGMASQKLQHVAALAKVVDGSPELSPTVVFRGVMGRSPGVRLEDMQAALDGGATVKLNGFVSTSLNPRIAHSFASDSQSGYVMAIVTRRGLVVNGGRAQTHGEASNEAEIIIPHGLKYKVHRIINHPTSNDLPVVQMIQID